MPQAPPVRQKSSWVRPRHDPASCSRPREGARVGTQIISTARSTRALAGALGKVFLAVCRSPEGLCLHRPVGALRIFGSFFDLLPVFWTAVNWKIPV